MRRLPPYVCLRRQWRSRRRSICGGARGRARSSACGRARAHGCSQIFWTAATPRAVMSCAARARQTIERERRVAVPPGLRSLSTFSRASGRAQLREEVMAMTSMCALLWWPEARGSGARMDRPRSPCWRAGECCRHRLRHAAASKTFESCSCCNFVVFNGSNCLVSASPPKVRGRSLVVASFRRRSPLGQCRVLL